MSDDRIVKEWYCRVCGFNQKYIHWDEEKGLSPTHEFCKCCDAQFGYNDSNPTAISIHRKKWINDGAKWEEPILKPSDWNLKKQLKNIPDKYKDDFINSFLNQTN